MSKTAMFMDGHFLSSIRSIVLDKQKIDYSDFIDYFEAWRSTFYIALLDKENEENNRIKFADALAFSGFQIVTKRAREYEKDGVKRIKGDNINVNVAIDMMLASEWTDEIILFIGDADIIPAVQAVQNKGVRVTVVGSEDMVSPELRKIADDYQEIQDILEDLNKERTRKNG